MVKSLLIFFCITLLGLSIASSQTASDRKAEAIALVEGAVGFLNDHGREEGLAEMNKPSGQFDKGEIYVFVLDLNGFMVAQPKNPKAVGEYLMDKPDNKGKLFRKEIIEKAKTEGSGWVDYFYLNPKTGKEEEKTTYLKRVGDLVVCCGVYR